MNIEEECRTCVFYDFCEMKTNKSVHCGYRESTYSGRKEDK